MANRQFSNIENLSFDDMAGRLWAGEAAVFAIWKDKKPIFIFWLFEKTKNEYSFFDFLKQQPLKFNIYNMMLRYTDGKRYCVVEQKKLLFIKFIKALII